jgi:hypothetical protein
MAVSDEASIAILELLDSQRAVAIDREIDHRRVRIDRSLRQIDGWRQEITRELGSLRSEQQMLDIALEAQGDRTYAERLIEEWGRLKEHPRLAGAEVRQATDNPELQSLFLVTTDDLRLHRSDTGESRWLGTFEIELTLATGAIKVRNLSTRRGGRDHPHVVDQHPCFGGHSDAFAQVMSNGDLLVLYELLIQYIETLNLEDEYGRYGAYWFEVDDERSSHPTADGDGTHLRAVAA